MGQTFFFAGLGFLMGPPVAGAIYGDTKSFDAVKGFAGATMLGTTLLMVGARVAKVGVGLKQKV
jgi:hypothetical protein